MLDRKQSPIVAALGHRPPGHAICECAPKYQIAIVGHGLELGSGIQGPLDIATQSMQFTQYGLAQYSAGQLPGLIMFDQPRPGNVSALVRAPLQRSEEHTSELQSLIRISYAVFCLNK